MIFKTCFLVAFYKCHMVLWCDIFLTTSLNICRILLCWINSLFGIKKWELIINIYNVLFSDIGLEIYRKLGKFQCIPWNLRSEFQARLLIINYNLWKFLSILCWAQFIKFLKLFCWFVFFSCSANVTHELDIEQLVQMYAKWDGL